MGERAEVEINSEVINGMPSELMDAPEAMGQFPGVQQRDSILSSKEENTQSSFGSWSKSHFSGL